MMDASPETRSNLDAYARLKDDIDLRYPHGQYVAIVRGAIVADAPTFSALLSKLATIEQEPDCRLVVQAGITYPYEETIFGLTAGHR